jgi:hypothetical protein
MKIEIYRNGEYYMTHKLPEMAHQFSEQASEARATLVKQTVILLRSRIRSVTGSDMGFTLWLVAQSSLNAIADLHKFRRDREMQKEATCTH